MTPRWQLWLDSTATFCLIVFPPLGVLVFLVRQLLVRTGALSAVWLSMGLPLAVLGALELLAGRSPEWLWTASGLVLLVGLILQGSRRAVALGGLAAVAVLGAGLMVERQVARSTWHILRDTQLTRERLVGFLEGVERLEGREGRRVQNRFWGLPSNTQGVRIELDARLASGQPGSEWRPFHPDFRLEYRSEDGVPFTRIHPPEGGSYITRHVNTTRPIAGRTFRARLELRASEALSSAACRGVLLREVRGEYLAECLAVDLTTDWQPVELVWTPPEAAQSSIIRIELRIPSAWYDVRNVSLEEHVAGEWRAMEPLEPTGVWVRLALPDVEQLYWPSQGFIPTGSWQTYAFEFVDERLARIARLRTVIHLEDGLTVAVRNVRLSTLGGEAATALPSPPRQQLWHNHQNLAGHSLATAGLLVVAIANSGVLGLVATLGSLIAVFFTASRAAWLAALVGLPWLLWWACRHTQRVGIFTALIVTIGVLVAAFGTEALGRLQVWQADDGNSVTRSEIWQVALDTLRAQPWTGAGEAGFAETWRERYPEDRRDVPTHAHNLWLQFGAAYGIPGLLAALWLTGGLAWLAWRGGRWRGLGLVVPVMIMQVFDYTLFYAGVLFPLILGLNALRDNADTPRTM